MVANRNRVLLDRVLRNPLLILFALYFIIGLGLSYKSLGYGWFWDDYHLTRTYTVEELKHVFVGNWDVDGIEVSGYRPLLVVFNDLRATLLGENPAAQRLFEIALFAGCLVAFADLAARLGIPYQYTALGGVLSLCSRYNWFNLVWITDALHAFVGLVEILAAITLLSYLAKPAAWKLGVCVGLATMGLFTREDAVVLFPLISVFGLFYLARARLPKKFRLSDLSSPSLWKLDRPTRSNLTAILMVTLGLGFSTGILFFLRHFFVPQAPTQLNWSGWLKLIEWAVYPMGQPSNLLNDLWLHDLWKVILLLLGAATLFVIRLPGRLSAFLWLVCVVITAAPGLTVQRINLLFFPTLFFGMFLATLFIELANLSPWMALVVCVIACGLGVVSSDRSMVAQEVMHPSSLENILDEFDVLRHTAAATPLVRVSKMKVDLLAIGVDSLDKFSEKYFPLLDEAKRQGRRHPNLQGEYFAPAISMLEP